MIGLWRGLIGIAGWQLAKFERELIKDRTDAGRVRAKARGVKFDRKSKLNPFSVSKPWRGCLAARCRLRSLAPGVDRATISRLASPLLFEAGAALAGN